MKPFIIIWLLFVLLFIYNILDCYSTKIILLNIEGAYEANPLMNVVIERFGINSLFCVKFIIFMFLGIMLFKYQKQQRSSL